MTKKAELKEKIKGLETKISSEYKKRNEDKREAMFTDIKLCQEILAKYGQVDLDIEREQYGCSAVYPLYTELIKLTLNQN